MTLKAENLHAGYAVDIDILSGLTVEARSRQLTTVIGANGVGKSTLLKCIVGQIRPHSGSIVYEGRDITGISTNQLVRLGIAYIAQRHSIFPHLSVRENLEMGCYLRRDRSGIAKDMERLFERFSILYERRDQAAGTLSGGEQQMLAISRALMSGPKLILFDEPSLGLAPNLVDQTFDIIRSIRADGVTVVMVEQNAYAALELCDRSYVLESGEVKLQGTGAELLENPHVQSAYLGALGAS